MTVRVIKRPDNLPDFRSPPLNEVVLGVQFAPPSGYQQIFAGEVWRLFKDKYPQVQEQAPLTPVFETFGLPSSPFTGQLSLGLMSGAMHNRFWFLREEGDELIQFQQDRLLHNWRKVADEISEYPRFEHMIGKLCEELEQLEFYMNGIAPQTLNINQCEVSYINHILVDVDSELNAANWLSFFKFEHNQPEDFNLSFREVILDSAGKPQGRLTVDAVIGLNQNGQKIIQLNLSARGAPKKADIDSAQDFICLGRELIVNRFAELTTDFAHKKWGRIK